MRLILLELIFFAVFFLFFPVFLFTDYPHLSHSTQTPFLYSLDASHPLTFEIPNPRLLPLNSLSLTFKNPALANTSPIEVILSSPQNHVYQHLSFSGANVGDPSRVNLALPTLSHPRILVTVSSTNPRPESLFIVTDQLHLPLFSTTYLPPSLWSRLLIQFDRILSIFTHLSPPHLLFYLVIFSYLHYGLLKKK